MKPNLEWAKIVGSQVIVIFFLVGGMMPFGLFPWATQKDLQEHRASNKAALEDMDAKYNAMVDLKNMDNRWYRELSEEVAAGMAGMKAEIGNLKTSVTDMRGDIKLLLRERR